MHNVELTGYRKRIHRSDGHTDICLQLLHIFVRSGDWLGIFVINWNDYHDMARRHHNKKNTSIAEPITGPR